MLDKWVERVHRTGVLPHFEQHTRFKDAHSHLADFAEIVKEASIARDARLFASAIPIRMGGRTAARAGAAALPGAGSTFAACLATLLRPFLWI